jgi:hypothetical protein
MTGQLYATTTARRSDCGIVRLGRRDIDGLILCAEHLLAAYLSAHRTMINGSALWRMRAASSAPTSLVLAPALLLFGPCNPAARARADA